MHMDKIIFFVFPSAFGCKEIKKMTIKNEDDNSTHLKRMIFSPSYLLQKLSGMESWKQRLFPFSFYILV